MIFTHSTVFDRSLDWPWGNLGESFSFFLLNLDWMYYCNPPAQPYHMGYSMKKMNFWLIPVTRSIKLQRTKFSTYSKFSNSITAPLKHYCKNIIFFCMFTRTCNLQAVTHQTSDSFKPTTPYQRLQSQTKPKTAKKLAKKDLSIFWIYFWLDRNATVLCI